MSVVVVKEDTEMIVERPSNKIEMSQDESSRSLVKANDTLTISSLVLPPSFSNKKLRASNKYKSSYDEYLTSKQTLLLQSVNKTSIKNNESFIEYKYNEYVDNLKSLVKRDTIENNNKIKHKINIFRQEFCLNLQSFMSICKNNESCNIIVRDLCDELDTLSTKCDSLIENINIEYLNGLCVKIDEVFDELKYASETKFEQKIDDNQIKQMNESHSNCKIQRLSLLSLEKYINYAEDRKFLIVQKQYQNNIELLMQNINDSIKNINNKYQMIIENEKNFIEQQQQMKYKHYQHQLKKQKIQQQQQQQQQLKEINTESTQRSSSIAQKHKIQQQNNSENDGIFVIKKVKTEDIDIDKHLLTRPASTPLKFDSSLIKIKFNELNNNDENSQYQTNNASDSCSNSSSNSSRMSVLNIAKRSKQLPELATRIMREWYDAHCDNPYPTEDERKEMAIKGQINECQVKAWFANKRNRTNNTRPKNQSLRLQTSFNSTNQITKSISPIDMYNMVVTQQHHIQQTQQQQQERQHKHSHYATIVQPSLIEHNNVPIIDGQQSYLKNILQSKTAVLEPIAIKLPKMLSSSISVNSNGNQPSVNDLNTAKRINLFQQQQQQQQQQSQSITAVAPKQMISNLKVVDNSNTSNNNSSNSNSNKRYSYLNYNDIEVAGSNDKLTTLNDPGIDDMEYNNQRYLQTILKQQNPATAAANYLSPSSSSSSSLSQSQLRNQDVNATTSDLLLKQYYESQQQQQDLRSLQQMQRQRCLYDLQQQQQQSQHAALYSQLYNPQSLNSNSKFLLNSSLSPSSSPSSSSLSRRKLNSKIVDTDDNHYEMNNNDKQFKLLKSTLLNGNESISQYQNIKNVVQRVSVPNGNVGGYVQHHINYANNDDTVHLMPYAFTTSANATQINPPSTTTTTSTTTTSAAAATTVGLMPHMNNEMIMMNEDNLNYTPAFINNHLYNMNLGNNINYNQNYLHKLANNVHVTPNANYNYNRNHHHHHHHHNNHNHNQLNVSRASAFEQYKSKQKMLTSSILSSTATSPISSTSPSSSLSSCSSQSPSDSIMPTSLASALATSITPQLKSSSKSTIDSQNLKSTNFSSPYLKQSTIGHPKLTTLLTPRS